MRSGRLLSSRTAVGGLAVAASLTLLVSGCSSAGSSSGGGGSASITWGTTSAGAQLATEKAIIGAFEKANPKIKVKVEAVPFDSYDTKISTALRAKNGPDVFQVNHPNVQAWTNAHYLADLSDLASSGKIATEKMIPALVSAGKVGGKTYTLPLTTDARALWYNPKLLKSVGVSAPPTTWAQLLADVSKFRGKSTYGFTFRSDNDYAMAYEAVGSFIKSAGGEILASGSSPRAVAATNSATTAAVTLMQKIDQTGAVPPGEKNMSDTTMVKLFAAGKVALMVGGPWFDAEIQQDNPNATYGKDYATSTIPTPQAGGTTASVAGGFQIGIASATKNMAAAQKLVAWMTTPANLLKQGNAGAFPPLKSGLNSPVYDKPVYAAFKKELPNSGLPIPPVAQLAQVAASFEKYVAPAVTDGKNVATQLKGFDTEVNEQVLK